MKRILVVAAALLVISTGSALANSMTVTPGAALGGTNFGLQLTSDGGANAVYVQSNHPDDETHVLIRFRLSMQAQTAPMVGGGRVYRFLNMGDDSAPGAPHVIMFAVRQNTTGNWRLANWVWRETSNTWEFSGGLFLFPYQSATAAHLECEWTRADAGMSNGVLTCDKLGTAQTYTDSDIDNDTLEVDFVQAGFFDFDNFNSAGSVYFDEYESYR